MEIYKNALEALKSPVEITDVPAAEDQAFGMMDSEALARFSTRQRAVARKRISDVLFEVEMGMENIQPNVMFSKFFLSHLLVILHHIICLRMP